MNAFDIFVAQSLAHAALPPAKILRGITSRTDQVTELLASGDKTYGELAEAIGVSTSAIRQVIKVLQEKKLVVSPGERDKCKTWRMV